MKKFTISTLLLLVAAVSTQAKYWKIGPSSVAGMDYASINAAMEADDVAAGDTLYLDQYYNENAEQTVSKAVVIIGTGYDNSTNDEQVVARLTATLHLKADDITIKSVLLKVVYFYNDNCVLDRCYANQIKVNSISAGYNHIYSCYIYDTSVDYAISGHSVDHLSRLDIQNCIVYHKIENVSSYVHNTVQYLTNSIINNNAIYRYADIYNYNAGSSNNAYYAIHFVIESTITNNYIYGFGRWYNNNYYSDYSHDLSSPVCESGSGNTIEHNILSRSLPLSYYPTNKINYNDLSKVFTCSGNYSNYYQLSEVSPAIGYATDGGDCGVHGGMFGCPSGGRPQYIPYFKKVTVGSRTEDGKLPVTLKIAIQSE